MVGVPGFEPGTSSLSGTRSNQLSYTPGIRNPAVSGLVATARLRPTGFAGHFFTSRKSGGKGVRTPDFQLAKLALSQLSYAPVYQINESEARPSRRMIISEICSTTSFQN